MAGREPQSPRVVLGVAAFRRRVGTDDSVSQTGFGDFPFKTTQRQYTWQNELTLPLGLLTAGLERREERVDDRRSVSP